MKAPKTRGEAINAFCRECIHDPAAAGTWREQTAACTCTSCPLWRFRPIQDARSAPDWIKSREPADLPDDFLRLEQGKAVRAMRCHVADKAIPRPVQPDDSARIADAGVTYRVGSEAQGGGA